MKTMFAMGFGGNMFGETYRKLPPRLGAGVDVDQLRTNLRVANDKMSAITDWMRKRPDYQTALGADLPRWNGLMASANDSMADAYSVQERISGDDTGQWTMSPAEQRNVNNWISTVDLLYSIMLVHSKTPAITAAAPAPAPPSNAISPLAIGVGAAAAIGLMAVLLK
jgi:hypothetical protein